MRKMDPAIMSLSIYPSRHLFWCNSRLGGEVSVPPDRNICSPHKRLEGHDARSLLINAFAQRSAFLFLNNLSEFCFQNAQAQQKNPGHLYAY